MTKKGKSEGEKRSYEFDDIFQHVPSFGKYQKILYFCGCLIVFPVANQFSLLVFGFGTPGFHCVTPNVTCDSKKCCDGCTSYEFDGPFHSTVSEVSRLAILTLRNQSVFKKKKKTKTEDNVLIVFLLDSGA